MVSCPTNRLRMETTAGKFMRAVVRMRSGTDVAVHDDVRVPVPGKGEVLIRVRAAALNPIDFKMPQLLCGQVPGQDVAGVVEACGPETVAFSVGDEVFGFASRSNGSLAEFCIADVTKLARKPLELSFESAAAMPVAYLTGYQALIGNAGLKKGDAVIVLGASGGCGTAGVQLAARLGAREVVGVCSKGNAELVLQLGATRCVDYADADAYAALTRDGRFDVIYDCASGNGAGADYSGAHPSALEPLPVPLPLSHRDLTPSSGTQRTRSGCWRRADGRWHSTAARRDGCASSSVGRSRQTSSCSRDRMEPTSRGSSLRCQASRPSSDVVWIL